MSIQINYENNNVKKVQNNLVLFTNEKFDISPLRGHLSKNEFSHINDLLKSNDLSKNLLTFELNSKKKIYLISVKKKS